jgi:hypothetical protein
MEKKKIKLSYIVMAIVLLLSAGLFVVAVFVLGPPDAATTAQGTIQPSEAAQTASLSSEPTEHPQAGITDGAPSATPTKQQEPMKTEDPAATYTIENARFDIDSTGKNARATTDGINAALEWAKTQGYETIKFVEGTYMIQSNWKDRFVAPTDGILVPSDITLDLGQSTFIMETNSFPEYATFGVVNQRNVTIKNGTLIGDLDGHVYSPSKNSPTHEYGFGICISASSNVLIQGVTIKNMTGDGVIIEGSYSNLADGGSLSSKIRILDCDISNCRRQGISVVGTIDSEIAQNKIYDIAGTAPGYGIAVKSDLDYIIDNLKIYDNEIYNCEGGAIACNTGKNCEIYSNVCSGNICVVFASNVKIYDNVIINSFIEVMASASNITVENNILDENSWLKYD